MYPILLKLGPLTLYSYGFMMVVAFLTVIGLAGRDARQLDPKRRGILAEQIVDCSCAALFGGLIGGRLCYVALSWGAFASAPWDIPALWKGGLVWYGGLFGGLAGAWLYVRSARLDFVRVMDQFIPFAALGHAIGRIGCFLNGCCYGRPTALWCGVRVPGQPDPVLPTQLFEAAGLTVLFFVLRRLQRTLMARRRGLIFGAYFVSYGALRFCVEFFRGDQMPVWAGLTLQQFISAALILLGLDLVGLFRQAD